MKIFFGFTLLACSCFASACAELQVANAWIRLAAPNANMMAAYMSLKNPSDQSILIQGLTSDTFKAVEMHTTEIVDGVAKMRQLDMLEVKAGQDQALVPGGKHLMLINPNRVLAEGEMVAIDLTLCETKQQTVQFVVAKSATAGSPVPVISAADEHASGAHKH